MYISLTCLDKSKGSIIAGNRLVSRYNKSHVNCIREITKKVSRDNEKMCREKKF